MQPKPQPQQKSPQAEKPARSGNPSDENFSFDKKHTEKTPTARDGKPAGAKESADSCGPCGGKSDSSK